MKHTTLAQYPAHTAGAARPCAIAMAGLKWRAVDSNGLFGTAMTESTNHLTRRLSEPPT